MLGGNMLKLTQPVGTKITPCEYKVRCPKCDTKRTKPCECGKVKLKTSNIPH